MPGMELHSVTYFGWSVQAVIAASLAVRWWMAGALEAAGEGDSCPGYHSLTAGTPAEWSSIVSCV
jgi:hypothetical protein